MKSERIYLASSWRNDYQPMLINSLRHDGYEVYDFRHPQTGGPPAKPEKGFSWKDVDPEFGPPRPDMLERFRKMLGHQISQDAFESDFNAMKWADTCVIALPCGRSAHLEAGWMSGAGKKLVVYMPPTPVVCPSCSGTGGTNYGECPTCGDNLYVHTWSFEPELMYMIGGGPEVLCFTPEEMAARLAA